MKEKILEIIDSKCETGGYVYDVAADEITAMVLEFVEWTLANCTQWIVDMSETRYEIISDGLYSNADYSLEEVFNYWLTNIYKK